MVRAHKARRKERASMGEQNGGPTLEGLAQRLEALTEKLGGLERENEALRKELSTRGGPGAHRSGDGEPGSLLQGMMSRRSLLSKSGAAAVAAVAAGTLLYPREARANHFGPGIEVDWVFAHSDDRSAVTGVSGPAGIYGVYGRAERPGYFGVAGRNQTAEGGTGVDGYSPNGVGVKGRGNNGVHGEANSTGWAGVYGNNIVLGYGCVGDGSGSSNAGVLGRGTGGSDGVRGESAGTGADVAGVKGKNTGSGAGIMGEASSSGSAGVYGRNPNGYGGRFEGQGKAHLQLIPRDTVGPPTAGGHGKGELVMDRNATLWVCVVGGGPGTWRRFQTAAT
jgi:hypothetical protein